MQDAVGALRQATKDRSRRQPSRRLRSTTAWTPDTPSCRSCSLHRPSLCDRTATIGTPGNSLASCATSLISRSERSSPDLCVKAEEAPRLRLGCLGDLLFLEE